MQGGEQPSLFARIVSAEPRPVVVWGVVALFMLSAGLADVLVGPYVVLATVYLLPVAVAAWYLGRGPGIAVALGCSLVNVAAVAGDPGAISASTNLVNGALRLVGFCFVAAIVSAVHGLLRQVRELAGTDVLTGLMNRRRFLVEGARELARSQREHSPLAMVCIDIDDLKARNDLDGHAAGDDTLRQFAAVTSDCLRATDVLARTGGDEFSLLLPAADLAAARATVERVMAALVALVPHPIGVSAGICAGGADSGLDLEAVMGLADRLMYEAKRAGKGRVCSVGFLSSPEGANGPGPADPAPGLRARSAGGG